jgi:hypothetical protein
LPLVLGIDPAAVSIDRGTSPALHQVRALVSFNSRRPGDEPCPW